MKKTLVALAALAAVGGAFAQSSVTLYGRVDLTLQSAEQKLNGIKTPGGNVGMQINSAGLTGSRWGLKGTEDLGGGMSAIFQLEGGFASDDATTAQSSVSSSWTNTPVGTGSTRLFGRQAYAGLQGGWGSVTAGRQYSPLDSAWGNQDAQGYTTNSAMGYAWNAGVQLDIGRIDNSIMYTTPAMGGFNLQVMYAPGENKDPFLGRSASEYYGGSVGYANGPFSVVLAYENIKNSHILGIGSPQSVDDWMVGGQYDFGFMRVYAGYEDAHRDYADVITQGVFFPNGGNDQGWMLGTAIPISKGTFNIGYAYESTDSRQLTYDGRSEALGMQFTWPLSKRTSVYADYMGGKKRPSAASAATALQTKNQIFGVGFRHDF